jgi:NTE family protein
LKKDLILYISTFICLLTCCAGFIKAQEIDDSLKTIINLQLRDNKQFDTNYFNIFPKKFNSKKIALVLSGGGARGISQIGVLKALEENNIVPDLIVGTSIGSIIGGLYSTGYSINEMKKLMQSVDWNSRLQLTNNYERQTLFLEQKFIQDRSLITIPFNQLKLILPSSISNGFLLSETINLFFLNSKLKPKRSFSDLKIPFASVATDLDSGNKVTLIKGSISNSIKASVTFPLLYSPTVIDNRNLVDGGLTANIPVNVAKELGADITITVNTTSPLRTKDELDNPLNTADQIISITMAQLNQHQLINSDIIITPELGNYSAVDFNGMDTLILKGYQKAKEFIQNIESFIDSSENSISRFRNNFIINPEIIINPDNLADSIIGIIQNSQQNKFLKFTDIETFLKILYNTGYYKNVYAVVGREKDKAVVRYILEKNPKLEKININSKYKFIDDFISKCENDIKGKILNTKECYFIFEKLLGLIRENEYPFIDIEKFYFDYNTNELNISISSGKINSIKIEGNNYTKKDIITRELVFNTTDDIKFKDIELSLKNLYSTNLFKQINFDLIYSNGQNSPDLLINLVEKNPKNIRISFKDDTERLFQLLLDVRDENFLGTGMVIGGYFFGGLRNRELQVEFRTNRFLNTLFTFNLSAYYKYRDIYNYLQLTDLKNFNYRRINEGEYREIRFGTSLLAGRQLEKFGTVYAKLIFEKQDIQNISLDLRPFYQINILKLVLGGIVDTRDKVPYPNTGTLINFYYETAQGKLGSNLSYSNLLAEFEQYINLGKNHSLRPKFVFGFEDKTTPLPEHFSIGGENSFYGMVEDEIRGRQILTASLEYIYKLPFKLFFDSYFSLRYDLGNVWENADDIRFKDLRHGIGFSLGFNTPIGKSSFSIGKAFLIKKGLKRDSFIWGPYTYYFSIGIDF